MKLTLGFSPCPNDTFIFDAMLHGKVPTHGLQFEYVLEDVETLNRWAMEGRLDITKLSYNSFLRAAKQYALLHSGSALGKGVGPLLIAKMPLDLTRIADYRIAIPGVQTTANLLLSLAYPDAKQKEELLFSEIEQAVLDGRYDAGLIIHENRFTYQQRGLVKLIDLGDWWEQTTEAAIPLGGIVMRRNHNAELIAQVDSIIKASIEYAWQQYPSLPPFVTEHAQEMEEDVMRKHINLYVNEYSTDLGTGGTAAIETMFTSAIDAGVISAADKPATIFY